MGRFEAGLMVIAFVTAACSYKHAGKMVAGGALVMGAGGVLWHTATEDEGSGEVVPTVSMVMVPIGLFIITGGVWAATRNCPPQR